MNTIIDDIPKVSRRMVWQLNLCLIAMPIVIFMIWMLPTLPVSTWISNLLTGLGFSFHTVSIGGQIINPANIHGTFSMKALLVLSKTVQLTPIFLILLLLKRIFVNYQKEMIFVSKNAQYYYWIGLLVALDCIVLKPLGAMFATLVITYPASLTPGAMNGWFIPSQLQMFLSLLIIITAQIMYKGSCLREENELTI